jgi:predicted kinase
MIIIVFGLPGSGKSFFASRLAERLGAVYLASDPLRKELFVQRTYKPEEKVMVYDFMQQQMVDAIKAGKDVVVDATFYHAALRRKFQHIVGIEGAQIDFIEIWAEEKLIRERVSRKRPDSDADYSIYLKIKAQFEPMQEPHLVLQSTDNNIEALLTAAMDYLKQKGHLK